MEIEEFHEYIDIACYGRATPANQDVTKSDLQLQAITTAFFNKNATSDRMESSIQKYEITPVMIKLGYSERENNGKERKVEITIDTRRPPQETPGKDNKSKPVPAEAQK